jgi:glycosyltransferase involved in cell wall biosynthesis
LTQRVAHIITGLERGGAESFLYRFLSFENRKLDYLVISLGGPGVFGPLLRNKGIQVEALCVTGVWSFFTSIFKVRRLLQEYQIQLVQSWLYKADLYAVLVVLFCKVPLIWNVRQTNTSHKMNSYSTLIVSRVLSLLSRKAPDHIVYCANTAQSSHERMGYRREIGSVIPNGVDCELFKVGKQNRNLMRCSLKIAIDVPVIINVGRYDPQKGHLDFLRCASLISKHLPKAIFCLVGKGVSWDNPLLAAEIQRLDLKNSCLLLGERPDIPQLLDCADVYLSCSLGEGWPNAIAEAMASRLPVVATDVGDSRQIIGCSGYIACVSDIQGLSKMVIDVFALSVGQRRELGHRARERIKTQYSVDSSVQQYESLYQSIRIVC